MSVYSRTIAGSQPGLTCPDCGAGLTGSSTCIACGLRLTGPEAARLWEVDVELGRLDGVRRALLAERERLLAVLRPGAVHAGAAGSVAWPAGAPAGRPEWTPRRVQNLLLLLGGLLLATAATVFAAVTYDRLGAGGRAAVLLALTGVAGAAVPRLRARGLVATAETLAAVTLALAALDAYGLRRLGVGDGLHALTWLAVTCAVLAAACAGYDRLVPLRFPRFAAAGLLHAAALLAFARLGLSAAAFSIALTLLAALDLLVVATLARQTRAPGSPNADAHLSAALAAAVVGPTGLLLAVPAYAVGPAGHASAALLSSAALAAGAAVVCRGAARLALAALPTPIAAAAALLPALDELAAPQLPLVPAAVALLGALAAAGLSRSERVGPLLGALAVAALSVLAVAEPVGEALLGPVTWLADPWQLSPGTPADVALTAGLVPWSGSAATLLVLLVAAATALAAGRLIDRLAEAVVPAAVLALGAALLVPVVLPVGHGVALALLLALAAGLGVAGSALTERPAGRVPARLGLPVLAAAALPLLLAATWSLADRGATLLVLPLVTLLLAAVATRPLPDPFAATATGLAGLAAAGALVAVAADRSLALEQAGALLLAVPALLLALARPALGAARRTGAETAAAAGTLVAVAMASGHPGWLSWTLALTGLGLLAGALAPDRRPLAVAGALALSAASWVRLADAGVEAPEPYVLPVAALALLLGHLRARAVPATRSHAAYGPGLALLLLPSLAAALGDAGLARPLLLGALALGVLLLGARTRLQAPLVYGGATVAVVALDLLAPYAAALPRWTALAAAGTLLVVVGATFEQRRREVLALKDRYEALG